MIIRCERCSTRYELDEALLSPDGSAVQCTRCQAIFTARPGAAAALSDGPSPTRPTAAAKAEVTSPAPPPPAAGASAQAPAAPAGAAEAPGTSREAGATVPARRAARPGPAIYRPPGQTAPRPATESRAPTSTRNVVSGFDARVKAALRWRLLWPALGVLALLGVSLLGWTLWQRRPDPELARFAAEAWARLQQDDAASLVRAGERYEALLARAPERHREAADRALVRVLQAVAEQEEAAGPVERLASLRAERERLQRDQPVGFEELARNASVEASRLETELSARRESIEQKLALAAQELKPLAGIEEARTAVARTEAVAAVAAGDAARFDVAAGRARSGGAGDPWIDLAGAWLEAGGDAAARQRSVATLGGLVGSHPELIRARLLLARLQGEAGKREEAVATLTALLAANPKHERAQRLRAALSAPPPAPPPAAPTAAPTPAPAPAAVKWSAPRPAAPGPAAQAQAPAPAPAVVATPAVTVEQAPAAVAPPPPPPAPEPVPSQPAAPPAPTPAPRPARPVVDEAPWPAGG